MLDNFTAWEKTDSNNESYWDIASIRHRNVLRKVHIIEKIWFKVRSYTCFERGFRVFTHFLYGWAEMAKCRPFNSLLFYAL